MLPDELSNNSKSKINTSTFLDKSYHSHLMDGLDNVDKRGRPDITHMSSMAITSTPLYLEKKIKYRKFSLFLWEKILQIDKSLL